MALTAQDQKYAEGTSRSAFLHSRYYVECLCDEEKELAAYHKSEIVKAAKWLESGLIKCAKRDGEI